MWNHFIVRLKVKRIIYLNNTWYLILILFLSDRLCTEFPECNLDEKPSYACTLFAHQKWMYYSAWKICLYILYNEFLWFGNGQESFSYQTSRTATLRLRESFTSRKRGTIDFLTSFLLYSLVTFNNLLKDFRTKSISKLFSNKSENLKLNTILSICFV